MITNVDERAIYQATKHIFVEDKAKIRKFAPVKKWIDYHATTGSPVQQIVAQYGNEAVYHSVMQLLSDRVYKSTSIASQRFPDLSESSTSQTIATAPIDEDATISGKAALNDITQIHEDVSQNAFNAVGSTKAVHHTSDRTLSGEVGIPLLFPVHLPFPVEHLLMEKLQRILELACYQYGVKQIPGIMQKQGWDCPESAELSKWAEILGCEGNLERQENGKPLAELLPSIARIRHSAVHRLRTDSTGLERFLADSEEFAAVLGDNIYKKAISQLRLEVLSTLAELTRNKESIQLQLKKAQQEIAAKRTQLDQEERESLRQMEREDIKYRARAGERLERALHTLGDVNVASKNEDTVPNGMSGDEAVFIPDDDSEFGHAEQFEDCSEV
jgi:hypothetical protein